jgi:signal transduction histidine kinase
VTDDRLDVTGGYDVLPDGVVVADAAGVVVHVNPAAARLTGVAPDHAVGRSLGDVLPFVDARGRDWWACTRPYDSLGTTVRQPETELTLPGVGALLVTTAIVRPGGPGSAVEQVVVALRGTQARARAERDRAELVATVAHELRSPLTSVKGFTSTLLAKWDRFSDDQRKLMLETVEADADRVTRLITELLDVARIDSGRLELHRSLVDLSALAQRHVDRLVAAGQPAARFSVRSGADLPETWADADKLEQVVANLLENAVRHGSGRVQVTVERAGDGIALVVEDEGPGVPPEAAGQVFTRFWRAGRRGGTGLGLYIVRGLVEAHGGTVVLDRSPLGGALFRVIVPPGSPPG